MSGIGYLKSPISPLATLPSCIAYVRQYGDANGGTKFRDWSPQNNTVSSAGVNSTTQAKFPPGSMYFSGSPNRLYINNSKFAHGTSPMAISLWMWEVVGTPNYGPLCFLSTTNVYSGSTSWVDLRTSISNLYVRTPGGGQTYTFTRAQGQWNHWAWIRSVAGVYTLYYNGVSTGITRTDTGNETGTYLFIGGDGSFYTPCYVDEVGFWNGAYGPVPTIADLYQPRRMIL